MAFLQSCFIRKNTPELRKKLEELGYEPCYQMTINSDLYKNIAACNFFGAVYYGVIDIGSDLEDEIKNKRIINCEDNEELFIALAALRDDTDKNQWFIAKNALWDKTYLGEIITYFEEGQWFKYNKCPYIKTMPSYFRKATVEEIIEHFNKKFKNYKYYRNDI